MQSSYQNVCAGCDINILTGTTIKGRLYCHLCTLTKKKESIVRNLDYLFKTVAVQTTLSEHGQRFVWAYSKFLEKE